ERFLAELSAARDASEHTRRAYGADLAELTAFCASIGVAEAREVTPRTIRAWFAMLDQRDLSKATIARKLSSARSFFRWLREHGHVEANPVVGLKKRRSERKLPG